MGNSKSMPENPIERLRNKLSPFTNLVSLLSLESVKIESGNPHLDQLILNDLKVCAQNLTEIHMHLNQADEICCQHNKSKLNYTELSKKVTEILWEQSKEDIEKWIEEDRKRTEENAQRDTE